MIRRVLHITAIVICLLLLLFSCSKDSVTEGPPLKQSAVTVESTRKTFEEAGLEKKLVEKFNDTRNHTGTCKGESYNKYAGRYS